MTGWTCVAQSPIRFISHRGESYDAPENTMSAFRLAVARQTAGFECDVYLTADNEIVCIHDTTTTRTADGSLTVASSTLAQLKELDAGSWKGAQFVGERIPTLSEALTLARDGMEIYVEIKCGTQIMPRLLQVMAAEPKATPERVVFISFNSSVISAVRQQLPAYRAYWLTGISDSGGAPSPSAASAIATMQSNGATGLDASAHALLDATYVQTIKDAGFSFHVWTVNDIERAAELAAMGVETITTDRGGYLAAALNPPVPLSMPVPVVHWTFDGGSTTNLGSGGSQYQAVLHGAPAFTNGAAGTALVLDGVDDYVSCEYQLPEHGTIALWYRPVFFYNFNSVFDNSVHENDWEMWIYESGVLRTRVARDGSGQISYDLNNLNGSNQWYHITLTWDRAVAQTVLYINGEFCGNGTITTWMTPGSMFFIGGGKSGNTKGRGWVDDVRVYDTVLTEAQVRNVHASVAEYMPVVYVSFDESTANTGAGGARYDATLFGDPVWTNGLNSIGKALALDGVDDYVSVPYRLAASGSVSLWYYAPGPWYNYNSLFDNSMHADYYECWIDETGTLQFRPAGEDWRQQKATTVLGNNGRNRWYHIVCTWDTFSSNMVLYVNGIERGRDMNANGVAWPLAGPHFYVGGGNAGNSPARGTASELQIFETALSSNRVAEIFAEKRTRHGGLIAYVPFDGTAEDIVGSNAVVLGGSPVYVKTQGGFYKGLSCGTPQGNNGDNASISNVMGSTVGTIALWYYARGPWYNYQTIFDNTVHSEYWECWIYNTGVLTSRIKNDKSIGGDVRYDLDNLRGPNSWYHIAYVWDLGLGQAWLYVDGVVRATSMLTTGGWVNPHPTLNLAGAHKSNMKGNGIWDEVRVYNRALMDEEVAALAVVPPAPPPCGTMLTLR